MKNRENLNNFSPWRALPPFYVIRAIGGILFLAGALIMAFNLWMTVASGEEASHSPRTDSAALVPAE